MKRPKPSFGAEPSLLSSAARRGALGGPAAPLADRMRPETLEEVVGQPHLLGAGRGLGLAIGTDRVPSMILWGPPGSGKTTLASVVSRLTRSTFVPFSAVLGGVPELRTLLQAARERRDYEGRRTLLFVDEIHRFNRAQQDAFLPHLEDGTVTLIGATTENPSFSVNAAVLSRCRVFRLEPLTEAALEELLSRALVDSGRGLGALSLGADADALAAIARAARGDARRALGVLEVCAELLQAEGGHRGGGRDERESDDGDRAAPEASRHRITLSLVERAAEERTLLYDKRGEEHYNVASALIKSLRGSDPDAAIYWLMRMLEAGEDPLFVLRRLLIFASEDVGNADPRALSLAVDADAAFRRLGMPEGLYPIAHACLYLASCPKSGAVGQAFQAAQAAIDERGALPVPKKLRNAVTGLMKAEGYGEGYRYPHAQPGGHVPGEAYLPDELVGTRFYEPTRHGLEQAIAERLARLRRAGTMPQDIEPPVAAPESHPDTAPKAPSDDVE